MAILGFAIIIATIGFCSVVICGAITTSEDRNRIDIASEAKMIHRRMDDIVGLLELNHDIVIGRLATVQIGQQQAATPKKAPTLHDYESSQRATLEEFKEQ